MADFKHIAVSLYSLDDEAEKKFSPEFLNSKRLSIITEIMFFQEIHKIPIVTIFLLPLGGSIDDGFLNLSNKILELAHLNQVKVSVLGKWYDLPGRMVDSIKSMIEETKDYDHFFFNLCMNYDGREEIVDACRIIALKARSDKLNAESISRDIVKENIYSSYFIPPDIIIKTGEKRMDGLLLWDSAYSEVYFTGRPWHEFSEKELKRALRV